jgi:hypothetical protein
VGGGVVGNVENVGFRTYRIAAGLVRLHKDGAIRSHKDASFYARLLRDFGATYLGPVEGSLPQYAGLEPYVLALPRGASASLAGSPGKGGSAFCRRTSPSDCIFMNTEIENDGVVHAARNHRDP